MTTIKVRENGSLLVEGEDVKLVDWTGAEYVVPKKPFSLCRCDRSATARTRPAGSSATKARQDRRRFLRRPHQTHRSDQPHLP